MLGGECEIRFRTCGFQGIYEATWNLGLQPSPKIDRVETRSPPRSKSRMVDDLVGSRPWGAAEEAARASDDPLTCRRDRDRCRRTRPAAHTARTGGRLADAARPAVGRARAG